MSIFRLAALLLFSPALFATDAITISNEIFNNVEKLFYEKDFEAINKLDSEYLVNKSRLPDGRWKISYIFSGFGTVSEKGSEDEWQFQLNTVNEWIEKTPNSPTPYLVKAKILIRYAWDGRSGAYAHKITDAQWKLFKERINAAKKVLDDSAAITAKHPYWYRNMEVIAKAQSWSQLSFKALYTKGIELFPSYYILYFRAADYYQPRWKGSKKQLRQFVETAVENTKEKEGLTLYARIYWSQIWALSDDTFGPGYAEWPKMKQGFDDIMSDYPESNWNLNAYAYYACMADDKSTAAKLFEMIADKPHYGIWRTRANFFKCKASSTTK